MKGRKYSTWSKTFEQASADYADEVLFGVYDDQGGCVSGEMSMEWLPSDTGPLPRLQVFSDAWALLSGDFADVVAALAEWDDMDITPRQFVEILQGLGFEASSPGKA